MKILVIANNPFSKFNNNGKTLEAIFSSFAREELCQLFIRPTGNDIDWDFCSSYFMVTDEDQLGKIRNPRAVVGKEIFASDTHFDESDKAKAPASAFSWKRLVREYLWNIGLWKNKNLKSWLTSQSPDLIFFVGGNSGFVYNIANYIADYLNIKIVTFFTDDYIIHPIYNNCFLKWHLSILKRKYNMILKKSIKNYCIGTKMAQEYADYFSVDFDVIMNLISIGSFSPKEFGNQIKNISYLGGLHLHRWKSISKLATLLPEDIKVNVYTFQPIVGEIKKSFDSAGVVYHGGLTGDELMKVISQSDALLHVESDDAEYKAITMLSVSTKIPEYLSSCRPILAIGPAEVASMQLLSENHVGYVINSSNSDQEIKDLLDIFLSDVNLRYDLLSRGFNYVKSHFDKDKVSLEFKNTITSLIDDGFRNKR